ncbi:MAG: chorismate mutase [Gaiellaceae bacterium]
MEGIEHDNVAGELRASITQADLTILEVVNRRVELVRRLREHKLSRGYPMVDPGREQWLVNYLRDTNQGPLSDDGVRALAERVIELTKNEVYVGRPESAEG